MLICMHGCVGPCIYIWMHMWTQCWPSFCQSSADRCHWVLGSFRAKYSSEHEATLKGTEAHSTLRCDWLENDVCKTQKKSRAVPKLIGLPPLILLPNLVHVKINGRAVLLMNKQSEVNDWGRALDHSQGTRRSLKVKLFSPEMPFFGEDTLLRLVLGAAACKLWEYGENTEQAVDVRREEHSWMWVSNSRKEERMEAEEGQFQVSKQGQQRKPVTRQGTTARYVNIRQQLTGHFVMLCSHWLILTLSSSVVHFFNNMSQPQYGSLAPTQALKGQREESSLFNGLLLSCHTWIVHCEGTWNPTGLDGEIKRKEIMEQVG